MSFTDLPPLPKSLSGISKMLGSDSGLISDSADAFTENINKNSKNNNNEKLDSQKDDANSNSSSNNSNNNNNSNTTSPKANSNNNSNSNNNNNDGEKVQSTTLEATNANGNENETAAKLDATSPIKAITTTTTTPTMGSTTLDMQLATLKKEMSSLRQLDLSLLSQLWALNDSIQEIRTMFQEQEDDDDGDDDDDDDDDEEEEEREIYTHSHTPSSYESASSGAEDDNQHLTKQKARQNIKATTKTTQIITKQPKLNKNNSLAYTHMEDQLRRTPSTSPEINGESTIVFPIQQQKLQKPKLPKPLENRPVPRMRSAPPPPPTNRKGSAPTPRTT